ncbi:conserved hypothetical protein [Ruegeria lacuscaerulensis ITI-1157]|nr:conserved hypothetical protein [Ruegeria lacuscaerulensis ITI-1157]SHI53778.1 Uncharacterized membrane protein [Ruegeria lacuscaerulensis ITI-1157]
MTEEVKRPRRWVSVLLVISLALNLLVAGVVLGTVLRFHGGPGAAPPKFAPALYRALPEKDRKALRADLEDEHRRGARERSEHFKELGRALRAVPFDADEIRQLLDRQIRSNAEIQSALQRKWLDRVAAMTDTERQAYADRLEKMAKPRKEKRKR